MHFSAKFVFIIKDMAQFELKSSSYSLHTTNMVKNPNLTKLDKIKNFKFKNITLYSYNMLQVRILHNHAHIKKLQFQILGTTTTSI